MKLGAGPPGTRAGPPRACAVCVDPAGKGRGSELLRLVVRHAVDFVLRELARGLCPGQSAGLRVIKMNEIRPGVVVQALNPIWEAKEGGSPEFCLG